MQSERKSVRRKGGSDFVELTREHSLSGEELYSQYLAGDEGAFESLVALYEKDLFHFILNIVRDHHDAKHLTIEAFARLAVRGKNFAGKSTLKTYLFAIGKNLAVRHAAKHKGKNNVSYDEIMGVLTDERDTPEFAMERDENKRHLNEAMLELKPDHRAVLRLLYFEDMSYRQAGKALHKSERQIEGLARRAKKALKEKLVNRGVSDDI